jgi:hypothetical protein
MAKGWTPERRARQAEAIRVWRPWAHSTGPRTDAGKARVSGNAWKGGTRAVLRTLAQILREQETFRSTLIAEWSEPSDVDLEQA